MKIIGITGGIGVGKSTVSSYLRERGYPIVDADGISRHITKNDREVCQELAQAFGAEILQEDGQLNRQKVASIAFSDPEKKKLLEDIVTQRVIQVVEQEISNLRQSSGSIGFLDAPLLFETNTDALCDGVWVITAEEEVRIRRVMARENCGPEEVRERIRNQMSEEEKSARATAIIDNSGDLECLYQNLDKALKKEMEENDISC